MCEEVWTEPQRVAANRSSRLLHTGQSIAESGTVDGAPPPTNTLGFRWSAVNNMFSTTAEIAAEEWVASRAANEENAERERRQFVYRFIPSVGRGASQQHQQWYNRPTQTGSIIKHLGEGFHINWLPNAQVHLAEIDADHWKTWVHQRLCTPTTSPRAITFFHASATEHLAFAKHLTAEMKTEEFISGKGMVSKWDRKRKQNHWFNALYNACAAGHYCGVRLVEEERREAPPPKPKETPRQCLRPDGSPWIDNKRWRETQKRVWGHRR